MWLIKPVKHHLKSFVCVLGNYQRREGGRGSTWNTPVTAVTHRGTYSEPRGGQNNFTRPLPSRQPPTGRPSSFLKNNVETI